MSAAAGRRVRWIGGSPCAGKSTIAGRLGATRYGCDDAFDRHAATAPGPAFAKIARLGVAERLAQPIDVQVDDVLGLAREQFPLIRRDVEAIPGDVVAEGAALLPDLLAEYGVTADEALFLVPEPGFARECYRRRAWAREMLAGLADPEAAFDRWMRRDAACAELIAARATALGYQVLLVVR